MIHAPRRLLAQSSGDTPQSGTALRPPQKHRMNPHLTPRSHSDGFSLIEVVLAMAIASVAIVTLVGIIPQGMATMRAAGDQAIEARIHQQLMSEMQMASFDRLDTFHQMEVYYDAQGEELGDSKSSGGAGEIGSFEHIYTARISVPAAIGGKLPETVGGAGFSGVSFDGGNEKNFSIRVAIVEIAAVGGRGADFQWDDPQNRALISTYQTFVTDMGQALLTND